jgi:anhydro-N-acetylmuramic acid kinase
MSGTSLDGIDVALVDFSGKAPRLVAHHFRAYSEELRETVLSLHESGSDELHRAALLSNHLSREYATAVNELLAAHGKPDIRALGCHGQTIRHRPEFGYTTQLVNGALLAELTGLTTVVDFRGRDVAAGGQGAPLVPAFHAIVLSHPTVARAIVNIGGIANVTYLPPRGKVIGFDTGPGNMLMDAWIRQQRGETMDRSGNFAASGSIQSGLLQRMHADAFFARLPPKSTGRDLFDARWLESFSPSQYLPADVQATLCELTATSIATAIQHWCADAGEVYVCGGGAHNIHLMRRISAHLQDQRVDSTAALGIDPDWVEAMAFAWLAMRSLNGDPGNLPEVTGAAGPRPLGAIYPA